jgi:hypothetical protein
MNDVEIINKQISMLTDRLDRCIARIEELKQDRQRLGYELHVNENHAVEAQLKKLCDELAGLSEQRETLTGAVAELQKRKATAQAAVAQVDAADHRACARGILRELHDIAPVLDTTHEHVDGSGPVFVSNPPACQRAGTLIGALFVELHSLGLTTVTWSPARWDVSGRETLKKELMRVLRDGWHYNPGATRGPITIGRRFIAGPFFTELFAFWEKRLESVLREQANEVAA